VVQTLHLEAETNRHKSGADIALTAFSPLALHPYFNHPTTLKFKLPDSLSSEIVSESKKRFSWRPGDQLSR
jgi:hypothetical protein